MERFSKPRRQRPTPTQCPTAYLDENGRKGVEQPERAAAFAPSPAIRKAADERTEHSSAVPESGGRAKEHAKEREPNMSERVMPPDRAEGKGDSGERSVV